MQIFWEAYLILFLTTFKNHKKRELEVEGALRTELQLFQEIVAIVHKYILILKIFLNGHYYERNMCSPYQNEKTHSYFVCVCVFFIVAPVSKKEISFADILDKIIF